MARRKSKYPDKPYVPSEDARRRFEALMEKPVKEEKPQVKSQVPTPKGELWNWNTLEDVNFE